MADKRDQQDQQQEKRDQQRDQQKHQPRKQDFPRQGQERQGDHGR